MVLRDVTEEYFNNAKPGVGRLEHDVNTEEADRKITELLYKTFGGDIRTLEVESVNKQNVKTPDALWNGRYWEYKSVSSENSVEKRIKIALEQLTVNAKRKDIEDQKVGIVIDISNRMQELDQIVKFIEKNIELNSIYTCDVIIKDGDRIIKIITYK